MKRLGFEAGMGIAFLLVVAGIVCRAWPAIALGFALGAYAWKSGPFTLMLE